MKSRIVEANNRLPDTATPDGCPRPSEGKSMPIVHRHSVANDEMRKPPHEAASDLAKDGMSTCPDGRRDWRADGNLHDEDGSASIRPDGPQKWYQGGQLHREDGPSVIEPDGTQQWWMNGQLHRVDGPAVIDADGTQEWHVNGEFHREDGPAIIQADGLRIWIQHNLQHRDDGPSIIFPNGMMEWYRHDRPLTKRVEAWIREHEFPPCGHWSDAQLVEFLIWYSSQ